MKRAIQFAFLISLTVACLAVFTRAGRAAQPPVIINEVLVGNTGVILDPDLTNYSGWIEIRNTTGSIVNLNGYQLQSWPDGATTPTTVFLRKMNVPANGYLLIWADETRKGSHVAFEMDMDGGELRLTAPDGSFDHVDFTNGGRDQSMDVSYGRDGGGWAFYDQPTPGAANTTPAFANNLPASFTAKPTFSVLGGRFTGPISVELASADAGATIRYTTDGSRPKDTSPLYTAPIAVNHTTVIRARAWATGKMVSPTATQTYLFNIPVNLPVVSLVTENANLFDPKIGMYVKGTNGIAGCRGKANWHQSWERPANFEFFEMTGPSTIAQQVNMELGLEISGNCTRNFPQKSFELKARKNYGDNDISYAFFDDKPMTSYRRLILRNGGNDNLHAFIRDGLAQNLSIGRMDIDRQAYRPTVVYINGQYWGLYDMREKADEDYVENNYGVNEEDFDMVELNGRLTSGSLSAWQNFFNYLKSANVASPAGYAAVKTKMDVNSFMDYIILQTFVANTDWPRNNTRWWDDHGNQYTWRWMLRDLDFAFLTKNLDRDMISFLMKGKAPTTVVFNKLWASAEFRNEFAQRYAVHLNTTFLPSNVVGMINDMADDIRPEIPAQTARWGGKPGSLSVWETEIQELRTLANQRPAFARSTLRTRIGSPPDSTLTVNIDGDGRVLVAGAEVSDGYSGPHFRNIPMTLTAVPDTTSTFGYWLETNETSPTITIPFTGDTTRTAVFDEIPPPPPPPDLVINEIHYQPQSPQTEANNEFVEIYSNEPGTVNLSGFTIPAISYTFPSGSTIDQGEYIVVVANSADPAYSGLDADDVFDFAWGSPDNQKFSNGGETVVVLDTFGQVADTVAYDDVAPWPTAPDGTGPTLALKDPTFDNSVATNWDKSRENGGSPGAVNFPPLPPVPPVVINEIHYNPTGGAAEFIELYNNGIDSVALDEFVLEGVDFIFPAGATIYPQSYFVIGADGNTYGGLSWAVGQDLADTGETITLKDGDDQVVDTVTYDDEAPWPVLAGGASLSLGKPDVFDNSLPANWAASRKAGGTPGAVNFPPLAIVINELHHTPVSPLADSTYEFLELYNAGTGPIDLSGYTFVGVSPPAGQTSSFPPGTSIAPGEYIVVADTPATYTGNGYQVFDFDGGLSDGGETVTVMDPFGNVADSVTYGVAAPWPVTNPPSGPSLSLKDPALNNSLPANWDVSRQDGGSPGAVNFPPLPPVPAVVINEIHYNPASGTEFIELYNDGPNPVALDGFVLEGVGYTFPATTLNAGEYLVIGADGNTYGGLTWAAGQDLADTGETITLKDSYNQEVDTVAYSNGAPWPTEPDGTGLSLSLNDPGDNNSVATNWSASRQDGGSPGAENFPPLPPVPPVVINEIHYNPTGGAAEFIEVYNDGIDTVALADFALEGVGFTFPTGETIDPGEYLVIGADGNTYGGLSWAAGQDLADTGETITLKDSYNQEVDTVAYTNGEPWPTAPDGSGPSLSYLGSGDNNVGGNWAASALVGGTPGGANFPALSLVINEIHYNPTGGAAEFIELLNTGATAVYLEGFALEGVAFTFPTGETIDPGEFLVIGADGNTYGGLSWAAGEDLDDDTETITLYDALGDQVTSVTYDNDNGWPDVTGGYSLAYTGTGDNNDPANWAASTNVGGSPGLANN